MGRGRHPQTRERMAIIHKIVQARQPMTVRGVAYQLFIRQVIPSMAKNHVAMVSRVVTEMREEGCLPWEWIVDETRPVQQSATWADPEDFISSVLSQYRKSYWDEQPYHVEVWSEKSTVSGVLAPVLEQYAVPFVVQHGFGSATRLHEAAQASARAAVPVIFLYVGDYDPSGLHMSEVDIPTRLADYGGRAHIARVALRAEDGPGWRLPGFPVTDKRKDPRYAWWQRQGYGPHCWELDALDPRRLRAEVEAAIRAYIHWDAWARCMAIEQAESNSMRAFFAGYPAIVHQDAQ